MDQNQLLSAPQIRTFVDVAQACRPLDVESRRLALFILLTPIHPMEFDWVGIECHNEGFYLVSYRAGGATAEFGLSAAQAALVGHRPGPVVELLGLRTGIAPELGRLDASLRDLEHPGGLTATELHVYGAAARTVLQGFGVPLGLDVDSLIARAGYA